MIKKSAVLKMVLLFVVLAFHIHAYGQQLQNPGFESWSNGVPAGWGTMGELVKTLTGSNPGIDTLTTDKHSGNYAALLTSKFVPAASAVIPGIISTGPITLDASSNIIFSGQPYTLKPISYDFWFKYFPQAGDTAFTVAMITRWNTSFQKRDTLAVTYGPIYITATSNNYTHGTVPFYWLTTTVTPDTVLIYFASSTKFTSTPLGSQLYIDDVHFNVTTSGIDDLNSASPSSVAYPNPSADFITISGDERSQYVSVFDLTGRLLSTYMLRDKSIRIDLSSFENGLYLYTLTDEHQRVLANSKFNVVK